MPPLTAKLYWEAALYTAKAIEQEISNRVASEKKILSLPSVTGEHMKPAAGEVRTCVDFICVYAGNGSDKIVLRCFTNLSNPHDITFKEVGLRAQLHQERGRRFQLVAVNACN